MINVQSEVITEYLTDSVNKEIIIESDEYNPETLNYYTGDISDYTTAISSISMPAGDFWTQSIPVNASPTEINLYDYFHIASLLNDWNYLNVSFYFKINSSSDTSIILNDIQFDLSFEDSSFIYPTSITKADALAGKMVCISVPRTSNLETMLSTNTDIQLKVWMINSAPASLWTVNYTTSKMSINYTRETTTAPEVWEKAPDFTRQVGFNRYIINNDNLVYEDFSLTESLCSRDNIKLGLCEAAHCEFSEVGVNNVNVGDVIKISSALPDYETSITDDDIFAINWVGYTGSGMQTSSSDLYNWIVIMNSPYSANWSDYIDTLGLASKRLYYQFNIKFIFNNLTGQKPTYFKFRYWTPINDEIWWFTGNNFYNVSDFDETFHILSTWDSMTRNPGVMKGFLRIAVKFYDENKQEYAQGVNTGEIITYAREIQFRIGDAGHTMPSYNQGDLYPAKGTLDAYLAQFSNRIPLGTFKVASVSNEYKHNIIRKKITAYDNLLTLEDNAADWYTRYMFGVDFYGFTDAGFEFARQIFSTYWNYITSIGLDDIENYDITDYMSLRASDYMCDPSNCYGYVRWDLSPGNTFYRTYAADYVPIEDNTLLYRVVYSNFNGMSDEEIMQTYNAYYVESGFDTMLRGFGTIGGVLIEEYRTGDIEPYNRICVNRGDLFMLSPDTTSIKVVLPSGGKVALGFSLCQDIVVQTAPRRQDLTNGHLRLCYYNYNQKTIFACESSITGRDVVRSLLEVCGCFFRLDRYKGLPEFVYPTKGGLYPSNTLYPADDLYPRAGTDQLYSMGKYISVIAENYEVKNYGRIQILKRIKSSDTQSVVEWQYEGDPDMENTYIIDDNIFYCAEEMEYDYDGMPEVAAMLEGMWGVISNLGYFPNVTQALGAPWLECGDRVGLLTYDGGFETFVFRRTLKGIQNLRDTYESEGDEITPAISNFGYTV